MLNDDSNKETEFKKNFKFKKLEILKKKRKKKKEKKFIKLFKKKLKLRKL